MSEEQNYNSDVNKKFLGAVSNKGMVVHPIGSGKNSHNQPRKELNENIKHGTSVFPFAAYIWEPQSFASRVTLHWHKEVELVRFSKGTFKISVDMHDLVVENEAFLLLPGNIMHTFDLPAHCEESAIVFDPKMLVMTHYDEVQSELFDALLSSNIPIPPIITAEHPAFNRIDKLYRYCARHGATKNASHRLLIKAKLLEIIALYHEYGLLTRKDSRKNIIQSKQDKLKDLLNYIDSHFAGPMTIRDASLRLGVTDQYFCRYFKKVTGMSFTEYLNDLRLRRAAKDIELTTRPISDIAFENGFENAGYFFKSFKLKFAVTPLRYRKRFIEDAERKVQDSTTDFGEHNPTLNPTDIDHTSAAYASDLNVNKNAPSVRSKNNLHREQGIISIRESKETEELSSSYSYHDFNEQQSENLSYPPATSNSTPNTAFLFEDEDEYDLKTHKANTLSGLINLKEDEPIDTNLVVNHLKTNEEIHRALKEHTISHLDALDNEEDLYDDGDVTNEEHEHDFSLSNFLETQQRKGKRFLDEDQPKNKENSTAKRTVFALQECFNLNNFNSSKSKKRNAPKKLKLSEEARDIANITDSALTVESQAKKSKPKTPSEIRDKIAELERRKNDPFGL